MRKIINCLFVYFFITLFFTSCSNSNINDKKIILDKKYNELFSEAELKEKGHTSTIPQYFTDISCGYNNIDGTKTLYVYASPIAYKTKTGKLSLIDTRIVNITNATLKKQNYIYTVANNDINSLYPKFLNSNIGIKIKGTVEFDFGIVSDNSIYSNIGNNKNFINGYKDMVIYEDVFSENNELRVYPTSVGSNCELIFRTKPNTFTVKYWLKLDNEKFRAKISEYGYVVIENIKENAIIGSIQLPIIKDSFETQMNNTHFTIKNSYDLNDVGDGRYILTLTLDNSFLESESIIYPINIFTSFELKRANQPDSAVYSNKPNMNSYLSGYSIIGYNSEYGIGRVFIRYKFTKYFNLKSNQIMQANYYIYNFTENSPTEGFEMISVLEDWCSITGNWNIAKKTGNRIIYKELNLGEMMFDISTEVKKWCDYKNEQMEHNGLLLKSVYEKEGVYNILSSNDSSLYKARTEIIIK